MSDVTQILSEIHAGDADSAERLFPLVYKELKRVAAARMSNERGDHTLQATALVHEAFLRLVGAKASQPWNSRGHFFAAAAEAMRRILVDHARNKKRLKRTPDGEKLSLDSLELMWNPDFGDILDLHTALKEFEDVDSQAAELVKLRCFAGQTQLEAASLLGISRSKADKLWAFARAWLFDALR